MLGISNPFKFQFYTKVNEPEKSFTTHVVDAPPTVATNVTLLNLFVEDILPPVPEVVLLAFILMTWLAFCAIVQPPAPFPAILISVPWAAVAGRVKVTSPALSAI